MSDATLTQDVEFTVGRVIARTFSVVRRHFFLLFVISLLFAAPPRILALLWQSYLFQSDAFNAALYSAGLMAIGLVFGYLMDGAGTRVIAEALSGKRPRLLGALVTAITSFLPLLLTGI